MKKKFKILLCLTILLIGCGKRDFYPDEDDPGLSRFTSRGYNIATMYINKNAYINTYHTGIIFGGITNSVPTLTLIPVNATSNTLIMSWPIELNNRSDTTYNSQYRMISLLMPVSKSFNKVDFIAMKEIRFASNTNSIVLQSSPYSNDSLSGLSNIYFVKINPVQINDSTSYVELSGLFDGNIGDSILITKGRFDFKIDANQIKF
jgi:hypothetical protein